jgi:hypothetical protein
MEMFIKIMKIPISIHNNVQLLLILQNDYIILALIIENNDEIFSSIFIQIHIYHHYYLILDITIEI